nr:hypothetical protein [Kingella kingae]
MILVPLDWGAGCLVWLITFCWVANPKHHSKAACTLNYAVKVPLVDGILPAMRSSWSTAMRKARPNALCLCRLG